MTSKEIENNLQLKPQTIGSIEADIAFFNAREALMQHQPDTAYRRAQSVIYSEMKKHLSLSLEDLKIQQKIRPSIHKT